MPDPTPDAMPFRWRSIAVPVFAPTLLFSIGEGAIIPAIPLVADNLGASLALAGLITGLLTIGELAGNLPSGWLVSRIGERRAMVGAALVASAGLGLCLLARETVVLALGVTVVGLATAVFGLARHAFLTSFVPPAYRARALSTLGGTFRAGFFIGPFLTAAAIALSGTTQAAFVIHLVGCLGAAAILVLLRDPTASFGSVGRGSPRAGSAAGRVDASRPGVFATIRSERAVLSRVGLGAALVGALRTSRQVILPLWAVSIGVDEPSTALIIGIAGGVDFALFYASGQIMDRFGRLWSAIPSMVGLGAGHLVLAATHDLPSAVAWFIAVAMLLSVANGLGSGLLMTLGADYADPRDPAPFLGAWRLTSGLGNAGAPLAVSAVTAVASLSAAAGVMGVLGFVGAAVLGRFIPRFPRR